MSVYLIAQLAIHDRERYAKYEAGFMPILTEHGGEVVSVDEAPGVLEGDWPWTRTVILRFADREAAVAWYHGDAYQALVKHRHAASSGNAVIVNAFG